MGKDKFIENANGILATFRTALEQYGLDVTNAHTSGDLVLLASKHTAVYGKKLEPGAEPKFNFVDIALEQFNSQLTILLMRYAYAALPATFTRVPAPPGVAA